MNRDEFEQAYAERSGITVEFLHEHGRYAIPCACATLGCDGWQMLHTKDPLDEIDMRMLGVRAESHLASDVQARATILEYEHALEHVVDCGKCGDCVILVRGALQGINRADFLEDA